MKLSITFIELKSPSQFFSLSIQALKIVKQLKKTPCVKYKSVGFWKKHYTMTLWNNEDEMRLFATSGAHLDAMKSSYKIANAIKVLTIDCDQLIGWKEAKLRVESQTNVLKK
jgi:hypothetical protein